MTSTPVALGAFVARVFLWLPPTFALWYLGAHFHTEIVAGFARLFIAFFNGLLVSATENRTDLVFVTTLKVQQAGQGVLTVEVNPLIYTYGLALFLALMLAARARWWRILAGAAVLLPFQGWGIAFDFLAQVGAKMGPEIAAQAGLLPAREAIALAYQLGNLLFPSLLPVMVWAWLERRFVEALRMRAAPSAGRTA
ncbi:MAG: exosortase H-associated membrane protein [Usitatibacter sp.]